MFNRRQPDTNNSFDAGLDFRNGIIRDELNTNKTDTGNTNILSRDFHLSDDEKLSGYLNPQSPMYEPLLLSIPSSFSRVNFLTNMTAMGAHKRCLELKIQIRMLTHYTNDPLRKARIWDFYYTFCARMNDAVGGFKTKALCRDVREININDGSQNKAKKKGFLATLFGGS